MLPSLHAKIYLIDEITLIFGSANFTNKGIGLANKPNKEIIIKKRANQEDLTTVRNEFWNHEEVRTIYQYEDFEEQVRILQSKYGLLLNQQIKEINSDFERIFRKSFPHEEQLIRLKNKGVIDSYDRIKNGYYKHAFKINEKQIVKVMLSKEGSNHQEKNYENVGKKERLPV
jgi:phosphatidylserine/phosphatidylglycerophosphate/cardiolipin synthase-like enzyme